MSLNKINACSCLHQKIIPTIYTNALSYEEQICLIGEIVDNIIDLLNGTLQEELKDYIEKEFNNIMMNAMYDLETETLSLYLEKVG